MAVHIFVHMFAGAHQQAHWKHPACTLLAGRAMLMKFDATEVRRGQRAVAERAEGVECQCACLAVLATQLRIDNQRDPTAVSSIVNLQRERHTGITVIFSPQTFTTPRLLVIS